VTYDIAVTLFVLGLVVGTMVWMRSGPEYILLGGLTLLLVLGIIKPDDALHGFSSSGVVTLAALFVVAEGIRQTGAILFVGQLLGQPKSLRAAQSRIMIPSAVMSMFLNNTPVVAMMIPVVGDWARKLRMSVSHLYLPLSYVTILGGMCTLIGTSTTIVLADQLYVVTKYSMPMFEIGIVGLPAMIAGLVYLLAFSKRLLPERKPAFTRLDDPREYTVEMMVAAGSPLVNKTIEEAGLRHLPGMYLMEIDRKGHILAAVGPSEVLQADDRLVFVGIVESIVDLQRFPGLTLAGDQAFKLDSPRSERCLIEAVVSGSCPYVRMTIRDARFRSNYNAVVIAVARDGKRVNKKIGDIEMQPGDTLLLEAHPSFADIQRNSRDFFLVSRIEDSSPLRDEKVWIARTLLCGMLIVVAVQWMTILKASMLTACAMIVTGCCRGSEAKRSIDWGVLILIGAGVGIGQALFVSGTGEWIGEGVKSIAAGRPLVALALIYALTMVLTNLITAKAAAVLVLHVALGTAAALGVSHMPFVIAVMMSAAASFATPIGYQTNLMVYGPGGYRYSDFMRLGGPLSIIVWIVTMIVAPIAWPF